MQFRKDINGLRAIAVIAVVLFHFNASWMLGGFAGVDVFFVISGFLMTGIIFRGVEQNNFSILNFYVARANRIIPALAFLCLVLVVFGWFYLNPLDYKELGKHVASSMGFVSNIVYWREAGYFDGASHEKWLLHTWSLSAEWQFYIIYPLVLVVMKRFMPLKAMKLVILAGTILGFIFCVIATYRWPNPAYYLLSTRAWEMMIGGVAYLYPLKLAESKKKVFELLGLALIILSYVFISQENFWPGYLAMIPVFGSFLVIQAKRDNSIITSNIIFQYLGKWSYSIYLWHWPIVVAIHYYFLHELFIYLGIALSMMLGFLSYRYIEKIKFRNHFNKTIDYLKCKPLHYLLIVGIFGSSIFLTNGILERFDGELRVKNERAMEAVDDWGYPKSNLEVGDIGVRFIKGNSDKNILFIGASHIEQTYPYVVQFENVYNIYYVTAGGCFVTPSFIKLKSDCSNIQNYKEIISKITFDKIVTSIYLIDSSLSDDEDIKEKQLNLRMREYDEFLQFARNHANEVYMILGEPRGYEFDPKKSMRYGLRNFITIQEAREEYSLHYSLLDKLTETKDVIIIDPIDYLCDEICPVMDDDFKYYYQDKTHMRPWYAKKHLNYLEQVIN